jgi:hypothetical protein
MIYAKPKKKIVYEFFNGQVKTDYEYIPMDDLPKDTNIHWLNCLPNISSTHEMKVQVVEYDERVAGFFVNMIKSICNMSEMVQDFTKPEDVVRLAYNNVNILNP